MLTNKQGRFILLGPQEMFTYKDLEKQCLRHVYMQQDLSLLFVHRTSQSAEVKEIQKLTQRFSLK